MKVFRDSECAAKNADPASFAGAVRMKALARSEDDTPVHLYRVEFEKGGRTHWHTHSGPQWLFVVEGTIRVQTFGGPALDLAPGDAVVFAPGEKHWHGAPPDASGAHLAINVDATIQWLEPVID